MNLTHKLSGVLVDQRISDGYINATAMASAYRLVTGKRKDVANWLGNKRTQDSLKHLSAAVKIPVNQLYQVFEGSPDSGGGTWLHPRLSVRFGMWLSDDFGFQVESWVEQWMTEGKSNQSLAVERELPIIMPTPDELDYIRRRQWEIDASKGIQVTTKDILHRSGYDRAFRAVREGSLKNGRTI